MTPSIFPATQPWYVYDPAPGHEPRLAVVLVEELGLPEVTSLSSLDGLDKLPAGKLVIRRPEELFVEVTWQQLLDHNWAVYCWQAADRWLQRLGLDQWMAASTYELDDQVHDLLQGKTVLVTGAAGSIGSELCWQVASTKPAMLVLLDVAESPLVDLAREIKQHYPQLVVVPRLQDITQGRRMSRLFARYKPQVVLHAAAYKHVPLLQQHVWPAVNANVWGTYVLAKLAQRHKVERFVLLSTDKAADPTCLMGATKWLAEQWISHQNAHSKHTSFITIRFGNVLSSRGSVFPLWRSQLAAGQPLTLTHEGMERFFISTPDACKRLLLTTAVAKDGGRFGFWMPTYNMQSLAELFLKSLGHKDYPVQLVGIRPGERLQEHLIAEDESLDDDICPEVFGIKHRNIEPALLEELTVNLLEAIRFHMDERLWRLLKMACPHLAPLTPREQHSF